MSNHSQLTARDIHGPYTQLLVNLAGKEGDEWLHELAHFLRKEPTWLPTFPVWRTVTIGILGNEQNVFRQLKKAGNKSSEEFRSCVGPPKAEKHKADLKIVMATVGKLGLSVDATTAEIYARAKTFGLSLCPPEVAIQLCLSFPPPSTEASPPRYIWPARRGQWLTVAMEPEWLPDDKLHLFCLRYIVKNWGTPQGVWSSELDVTDYDSPLTGIGTWLFVDSSE